MVVMDRSLLMFDLVTRLSQVIKSADSSDIETSNKIIQRVLDSCRCLKGDYRLLSTLEQSTVTLLLDLATTHEYVRSRIFQPLVQTLFAIENNISLWCDKFESDFGKTFLLQLLKCDAIIGGPGSGKVSAGIVSQLEVMISRVVSSVDSPREMIIMQGMFEVIGAASQYPWIDYFRSIVNFSQRAIRVGVRVRVGLGLGLEIDYFRSIVNFPQRAIRVSVRVKVKVRVKVRVRDRLFPKYCELFSESDKG
jgi:hypothetical protein